jgi:hypothetical protein
MARKWVVPVLGLETVELMARKRVVLVLDLEAVAGSGFGSGWVVDFLG